MTKSIWRVAICGALGILGFAPVFGQNGGLGQGAKDDRPVPVTTAVPFLRIAPDARAGAMGDVGLATSVDANATFHNPSKLAFAEENVGLAINYVPWLRALVNDIYLAHLSGYYKVDDLQTIGASFRYFSLGNIQFTNAQGQDQGQFKPHEFALDVSYARKLADNFSTGLALRFIYSNLATGQTVNGITIKPGIAAAADVSFSYRSNTIKLGDMDSKFAAGLMFSNIGSKITYTESTNRDFIPMNLGLGFAYTVDIDEYNQITLGLDLNKLLVPTPPDSVIDADNNGIQDYREKSVPEGLFGSFGDAPGGFGEEFNEITWSTGLEYWYDQQFAVRAGYFYEHPFKGNRHYFTAGLGIRYSVFGLDFSYLIPASSVRNPLDNTLRFSLMFNFAELGQQQQEAKPIE